MENFVYFWSKSRVFRKGNQFREGRAQSSGTNVLVMVLVQSVELPITKKVSLTFSEIWRKEGRKKKIERSWPTAGRKLTIVLFLSLIVFINLAYQKVWLSVPRLVSPIHLVQKQVVVTLRPDKILGFLSDLRKEISLFRGNLNTWEARPRSNLEAFSVKPIVLPVRRWAI